MLGLLWLAGCGRVLGIDDVAAWEEDAGGATTGSTVTSSSSATGDASVSSTGGGSATSSSSVSGASSGGAQSTTGGGATGTTSSTTGGGTMGSAASSGATTGGGTTGSATTTGATGNATTGSATTGGNGTSNGGTTGGGTTGSAASSGTTTSGTSNGGTTGATTGGTTGTTTGGTSNGGTTGATTGSTTGTTTGGTSNGGTTGTTTGGTTGVTTGGTTGGTTGTSQPPPIVGGAAGWMSRYWDCCKPSCGFSANVSGVKPMTSCDQQNQSLAANYSAVNACSGSGTAYMCWSAAPWQVSDTLAYGFVSASGSSYTCGACYQIQFTGQAHSGANDGAASLQGKTMIVQVVANGATTADQFDLLVPGGGTGIFNACSAQWGSTDLGAQYGGFLTTCSGDKSCVRQKCQTIFSGKPDLLAGCNWLVDWFEAADNPAFVYQPIACPAAISQRSGMLELD